MKSLKSLLVLFLLAVRGIAAPVTPQEWVEELSSTYAGLLGFTATYHSEGPGKSLDVTLGLDEGSGISALHMTASKDGHAMEAKLWNTPEDEMYLASGHDIGCVKGVMTEMNSLQQLAKSVTNQDKDDMRFEMQLVASMWMTKDGIQPSLGIRSRNEPSWKSEVQDASVKASDDKTVTFETAKWGLLTISRETGLMTRQSITSDDGEVRVLELRQFKINPGRDAITAISNGWTTEGAKTADAGAYTRASRLKLFQILVDAVETGDADLEKLESVLSEQRPALRGFAKPYVAEVGNSLATGDAWKKILGASKDALRKLWEQKDGSKVGDEAAFERYLGEPAIRAQVRDELGESLSEVEVSKKRLMWEIFGHAGDPELKASNKTGEAAKAVIEHAMARAYIEAVMEQKMKEFWGARDGLD